MKKIKVAVGLSGGVDSAVTALLLKNEGYDVVGVFMRNWDSSLNNDIFGNKDINNKNCPQELDYKDAQETAKILGIEIKRIDFIKEYWDDVFMNFIEEYKLGRTPNPDINCNKYIKFDRLLNYVINELKCDFLATGHYVRKIDNLLYKGIDNLKDQSYFLAQLSLEQVSKSLFPLGNFTKKQVRQMAEEAKLNVYQKKDSTGICFIGERKFDKFLENYIPAQPGNIVDIKTNKIIGKHNGVMYYTIGQRKGLNLGGLDQPYFLVAKNIEKKILYAAASSEDSYLLSNKLKATNLNLFTNDFDENNLSAKFRYRQNDVKVKIKILNENEIEIEYDPFLAITPGQQVVVYENDKLIAGAIIDKIFWNNKEIKLIT
ncbi:MAG: tRNA 2-thiouridine(34) synthase MnmA [Metamycoplasmataceae bacterium]